MASYIDVTPIIPNTTMRKYVNNEGVEKQMCIKPIDGYVLHDSGYDEPIFDEITMEEIGTQLGYRRTEARVGINYDFSTSTMLDEAGNTVTAYGIKQFYTKPESDVPENQIFGGGNNNHEIM